MKRKETRPAIDLFSEQRILEALPPFTLLELKLKGAILWEEFERIFAVIRLK